MINYTIDLRDFNYELELRNLKDSEVKDRINYACSNMSKAIKFAVPIIEQMSTYVGQYYAMLVCRKFDHEWIANFSHKTSEEIVEIVKKTLKELTKEEKKICKTAMREICLLCEEYIIKPEAANMAFAHAEEKMRDYSWLVPFALIKRIVIAYLGPELKQAPKEMGDYKILPPGKIIEYFVSSNKAPKTMAFSGMHYQLNKELKQAFGESKFRELFVTSKICSLAYEKSAKMIAKNIDEIIKRVI